MSFIQCKNEAEVEKILKERKHGFVTEDFRIYDSIHLSDDACYYTFDSEEAMALSDLKMNIEMVGQDGHETSFTQLVKDAELLEASFRKVAEILKRRGKNGS